LAEGVSTSPSDENDGIGATTDAMRAVASRAAGEIRKDRPQIPD
jgi:hypothetical protein